MTVNLQERARNDDILKAVSTDHSPVFCLLLASAEFPKRPGILTVNLQETIRNADILKAVSTCHSPVFCLLLASTEFPKGPGIWKFNNSLIFDSNFVKEMKCHIHDTNKRLATEDIFDKQFQWEILKYEIRKISIRYSKVIATEK